MSFFFGFFEVMPGQRVPQEGPSSRDQAQAQGHRLKKEVHTTLDSSRKQVATPPETALRPLSGEQELAGVRSLRPLKPPSLEVSSKPKPTYHQPRRHRESDLAALFSLLSFSKDFNRALIDCISA